LKDEPKAPVKLELLDPQGKVIRAFNSEEKKKEGGSDEWERDEAEEHIPAKAGLNQFTWDLRTNLPRRFPPPYMTKANPAARSFFPATIKCA